MTKPKEAGKVVEGEVLLHSSNVSTEAVCERLSETPELLSRAFVVLEGGLYKLIVPGRNEEEMELTVLTFAEKELKSTQKLEAKLAGVIKAVGYDDNAGGVVLEVATKLMADAYVANRRLTEIRGDIFSGQIVGKFHRGGAIENIQMAAARPLTIFTARGWQAAKDVANENWERGVLDAMRANDETRLEYLAAQAAKALETAGSLGIEANWRQLYKNSMTLMLGAGNYPSLDTAQGLQLFMEKIYAPQVALLLAAPEIASVMGDHQAAMTTANLKKQMEIEIAEQAADTAEKVQPARARAEVAKTKADAAIAKELAEKEDVLYQGKRIGARLVAATVTSPLFRGLGETVEAGSEATPAIFKGFAEYLHRWKEQDGVDVKLVGVTSGGLALGIVAGAVILFVVSPLAAAVTFVGAPTAAAAGYIAFRSFKE